MSLSRTLAVALFGLLALAATTNADGTGDGTAYSGSYDKDATGLNSCGFGKLDDQWERLYAALPSGSFNREAHCGQCIRVKGLDAGASGNWVVVKIVDECASCSGGDVDFSTEAFELITGFKWDRKKIQWEFCPCSGASTATEESVDEPKDEEAKQQSEEQSDGEQNDEEQSDEKQTDEEQPEELEGDLNGDGKLSKREKRKLRKAKREAEEDNRRRLRA